jgi:hypothetical protein
MHSWCALNMYVCAFLYRNTLVSQYLFKETSIAWAVTQLPGQGNEVQHHSNGVSISALSVAHHIVTLRSRDAAQYYCSLPYMLFGWSHLVQLFHFK